MINYKIIQEKHSLLWLEKRHDSINIGTYPHPHQATLKYEMKSIVVGDRSCIMIRWVGVMGDCYLSQELK